MDTSTFSLCCRNSVQLGISFLLSKACENTETFLFAIKTSLAISASWQGLQWDTIQNKIWIFNEANYNIFFFQFPGVSKTVLKHGYFNTTEIYLFQVVETLKSEIILALWKNQGKIILCLFLSLQLRHNYWLSVKYRRLKWHPHVFVQVS